AKDRAEQFIRGLPSSAVAVVMFAAEPTILSPLSTDRRAAEDSIRSITPTDQPADAAAALHLCAAMLAGEADENGPRAPGLVVLFSDGGFPVEPSLSLSGAEFRFERVGAPDPENLGIVALA